MRRGHISFFSEPKLTDHFSAITFVKNYLKKIGNNNVPIFYIQIF